MPPAALPGASRRWAIPPPWWAAGLPELIFVIGSGLREGVKGKGYALIKIILEKHQNFFYQPLTCLIPAPYVR